MYIFVWICIEKFSAATRTLNTSRPQDRLQVTSGGARSQSRNESIVQAHAVQTIGVRKGLGGFLGCPLEVSRSSGGSQGVPWGPWVVPGGSLGGLRGSVGVRMGRRWCSLGCPWGVPGEVHVGLGGHWKTLFFEGPQDGRVHARGPRPPGIPWDPPDPGTPGTPGPPGTRGLSQSLRCAIASLFAFAFAFASLHFAFASLRFSLRFISLFESNQLEFRTPHADVSADIHRSEVLECSCLKHEKTAVTPWACVVTISGFRS